VDFCRVVVTAVAGNRDPEPEVVLGALAAAAEVDGSGPSGEAAAVVVVVAGERDGLVGGVLLVGVAGEFDFDVVGAVVVAEQYNVDGGDVAHGGADDVLSVLEGDALDAAAGFEAAAFADALELGSEVVGRAVAEDLDVGVFVVGLAGEDVVGVGEVDLEDGFRPDEHAEDVVVGDAVEGGTVAGGVDGPVGVVEDDEVPRVDGDAVAGFGGLVGVVDAGRGFVFDEVEAGALGGLEESVADLDEVEVGACSLFVVVGAGGGLDLAVEAFVVVAGEVDFVAGAEESVGDAGWTCHLEFAAWGIGEAFAALVEGDEGDVVEGVVCFLGLDAHLDAAGH
jgi:hypothetical protein